ncbi:MAG: crossover junction endodeoxyribonuclease RuvC [Candidatus Spechtbacterales bacterium]
MTQSKKILGIDPGTARMGYGLIDHNNNKTRCIQYGVITTSPELDDASRLGLIHKELTNIITKNNPDLVAVEDIFYFKNQKTVVQVSQARGVALALASLHKKEYFSFTPLQIKQAVTGYGRADKNQVQEMVRILLGFAEKPEPDDAADALAVAICCAHTV